MYRQQTSPDKQERGTSLSQEQYDLIVSFLNTGVKPSLKSLKAAKISGNLNGGPGKSGFYRFRSIANRMTIRSSDGALLFKTNNKIVLPNSKFAEVIKDAHSNDVQKHLTIVATIEKLSASYTIGCRQFGISEEVVRDVVKSCKTGSCGLKTCLRNVVGTEKKDHKTHGFKKTKRSKETPKKQTNPKLNTAVLKTPTSMVNIVPAPSPTCSTSGQPYVKQTIPFSMLQRLPNGNFTLKSCLLAQNPGIGQQVPLSMSGNNFGPISIVPNDNNTSQVVNNSGSNIMTSAVTMASNTPNLVRLLSSPSNSLYPPQTNFITTKLSGTNNAVAVLPVNQVPYNPIVLGTGYCNTSGFGTITGQQMHSTAATAQQPVVMGTGQPSFNGQHVITHQNLGSNIGLGAQTFVYLLPHTHQVSPNSSTINSTTTVTLPSSCYSTRTNTYTSAASDSKVMHNDMNNNVKTENTSDKYADIDKLNESEFSLNTSTNSDVADISDVSGCYPFDLSDIQDNSIDLSTTDAYGSHGNIYTGAEPMIIEDYNCTHGNEQQLGTTTRRPRPIVTQFSDIWYFRKDLNAEENPYQRTIIATKDMKLDMNRAVAGDIIALDRMQIKMHVLQNMIKRQQLTTNQLAGDYWKI